MWRISLATHGPRSTGSPSCTIDRTFRAVFGVPSESKKRIPRRTYRNPVVLALEWQKALDDGVYTSRATLARGKYLSRARVTQVLDLLRLPSDVQKRVMGLGDPLPFGIMAERWLRRILGRSEDEQRSALATILARGCERTP